MVLHYWGVRVTRRALIQAVGATEETGTSNTRMITAARAYGMRVHARSNATIADIEAWLEKGVPVIINYIEPEHREGHYAVIVGSIPTALRAHDPWHGKEIRISKKYLQTHWRGGFTRTHRWLMAAQPKHQQY